MKKINIIDAAIWSLLVISMTINLYKGDTHTMTFNGLILIVLILLESRGLTK